MKKHEIIPAESVQSRILMIRGEKVIIDADLAELYGVSTKRLNEQVRRNRERFPEDFMSQLSPNEKAQVVANCDHLRKLRFSTSLPYVFTEHGAIMVAGVLNSPRAVQASIYVVRAFVRLRNLLATHKELAGKLGELEQRISKHDADIQAIVVAIRRLMERPEPEPPPKRRIGFGVTEEPKALYRVNRKKKSH